MRPKLFSICLLLTLLTIATYWPVTGNQFIAFDDQLYVTENTHVISGISWQGAYWAFTSFDATNWHPVTWLSHQLDVTLFGLDPGWHHAMNLVIHVLNTLLLVTLLARLSGALWRSALVAALFAIHPLHVESVAWVAERKDLLCAFFFLLTLHAYLRYTRRMQWRNLLPATLLFALSLLSKPMAVSLPLVLLLLDWWPLRRVGHIPIRTILAEKTPFILLSGASCLVTIFAQQTGGAVISVAKLGILARIANALSAYVLYLWQMLWPHNLAILYPLPTTPSVWLAVLGAAIIILATIAGLRLRNSQPYLLAGWLWFLGMLVPVIGLFQVGVQSHADRYTYLPMIGCSVAVVWGMCDIAPRRQSVHAVLKVLAAGLLLLLALQSRQQVLAWRDSETLFRQALAVTADNYVIHMNLGIALWKRGQQDEAIAEYRKAITICPEYADLHFFLANALLVQDKAEEAINEYRTTLGLHPDFPYTHTNLGMALQKAGRMEEAVAEYQEGLRVVPGDYKARENMNILLRKHNTP
jgi:tetratricopeptide (TPR) repeat protein